MTVVDRTVGNAREWSDLLAGAVDQSGPVLFRIALRILQDPSEAEDVCQQAFLKAWEYRDRLAEDTVLASWLTKVVVNEALRIVRHRKVETRAMAHRMVNLGSTQSRVDRIELRESVLLALSGLKDQTRAIVMLRLLEGYSGNQVKDLLGCSASEVSRRLHEGIDVLRRSLSDYRELAGT